MNGKEGIRESCKFLAVVTRNGGTLYQRAKEIGARVENAKPIDFVMQILPDLLEDKKTQKAIGNIVSVVVDKPQDKITLVDIIHSVNVIFGDEELGNEIIAFFSLLAKAGESLNSPEGNLSALTS